MDLRIGDGIGPLTFGMTKDQVANFLGQPQLSDSALNKIKEYLQCEYFNGGLILEFYSKDSHNQKKLISFDLCLKELYYKNVQIMGLNKSYILQEVFGEFEDWEISEDEDWNFVLYSHEKSGLTLSFVDEKLDSVELQTTEERKFARFRKFLKRLFFQ